MLQVNKPNNNQQSLDYILMADIKKSSDHPDPNKLITSFISLITQANERFKENLKSPLTITLGDEFQGVPDSLQTTLDTIVYIEEELIKMGKPLTLRYVIHQGEIQTEINPERAWEMLGTGLTDARKMLENTKNGKNKRIQVALKQSNRSKLVENLLFLYTSSIDNWKSKDWPIVTEFIQHSNDYSTVAETLERNAANMWKKRKTLNMTEYFTLKESLKLTADTELFCAN